MGNIIILWAISPFQPFQGNTIFQPVPLIHCLELRCWIQRSSNKLARLFIASFSQHYTNRIDVFLCIQYFAICAFQLTVCLVQIMSILKGNCKSFSFLHPCICNSACYISLGCLLVWKWCQYWEEMMRSLQWEHRHGVGAGCWRVHILMSRVFLDAQALGDLALMTSIIKPRFLTWLAWLKMTCS